MHPTRGGALPALALLICAFLTQASEAGGFDDRITGDWGGNRETLSEHGVDLDAGYIGEWVHNTQGGQRNATAYSDQLMVAADLDFEELLGWRGGSLHTVITDRNGSQLDAKAGFGTLLETQEIYGRGHYTRLTRVYLQQEVFDHRLIFKIGRSDVDFFPLSCDFINISFCGPLPGYHGNGWFTWPISQYFADLTLRPGERFYYKLGVSDVNPDNLDGGQGLRLLTPDKGHAGVLANFEAGWLPSFGELQGAYRFGYWHNTADYPDMLFNQQGQPLPTAGGSPMMHHDSNAWYIMARQQLTRSRSGGGLSVFFNFSQTDGDINRVNRLLSVGLEYIGPFASRPKDRLLLALGENRTGGRFREFQLLSDEQAGLPATELGSEKPLELDYSIVAVRGLYLMPSLQYVIDPGGRHNAQNLLVWGLRISADL